MSSLKGERLYRYLVQNVEDELSQEMKEKKEKAFSGDAEALYQVGIYYRFEAKRKRDTDIFAVGIRFLAEAAKIGHEGARETFREDGEDWHDHC